MGFIDNKTKLEILKKVSRGVKKIERVQVEEKSKKEDESKEQVLMNELNKI